MKPDCLFCQIAVKQVPSQSVAETDRAYAFRDINPAAPQHVLVIPKQHIADSLSDLNLDDSEAAATWVDMARVVQNIATGPEFADGWRLVSNVGEDGRQSVFHLHLHLLAGRMFGWPPG